VATVYIKGEHMYKLLMSNF